jgi:SRSO17 transposase
VTPDEITRVRPQLLDFAKRMFVDAVPRKDQRAKGELYLRGLLTDGQPKSMQPMAQRLGVDHQGLQRFVTSSTWEPRDGPGQRGPVGCRCDRSVRLRHRRRRFPKDGKASPLVARMYSGTLGKTANCHVVVSVQLVTDAASLAANLRLYCPASWDDATVDYPDQAEQTRRRRVRAGVSASSRSTTTWSRRASP